MAVEGRISHMSALDIDKELKTVRMTSIICTIGPKTASVEMLRDLRDAGMNIVRLNFSHGSYEYHGSVVDNVRKVCGTHVPGNPVLAIALDTKGPEIRTGMLKGGADVRLQKGQELTLTTNAAHYELGDAQCVFVDYKNITSVIEVGKLVYIDDGLISVKVTEVGADFVRGVVQNSAALGSRKGVNLPETRVDLPAVSERDRQDLLWGVDKGVDMIFASFVRKAADVHEIRAVLGERGRHIKIISKIENHEGVRNFDSILAVTDGVMVARGDLGIEIPPEKVFIAQKMMISKCNIVGKPIICATQMLESMTFNPRPTRAEVSDVANAVLDGADCVMLSGETAKGEYPLPTVRIMSSICREAEAAVFYSSQFNEIRALTPKPTDTTETVALAAVNASLEQGTKAIISLTQTGTSARLLSKYRPKCPIITVCRRPETARQVHLYRGCFPLYWPQPQLDDWALDVKMRIDAAIAEGKRRGWLKKGDFVITVQGWAGGAGHTNTMRSVEVE